MQLVVVINQMELETVDLVEHLLVLVEVVDIHQRFICCIKAFGSHLHQWMVDLNAGQQPCKLAVEVVLALGSWTWCWWQMVEYGVQITYLDLILLVEAAVELVVSPIPMVVVGNMLLVVVVLDPNIGGAGGGGSEQKPCWWRYSWWTWNGTNTGGGGGGGSAWQLVVVVMVVWCCHHRIPNLINT